MKVREIFSAHPELKKIQMISIGCYAIYEWIVNVIKYW
jgi:hypothetical protein